MKEDSIWVKNLLFLQNCWALTTIKKKIDRTIKKQQFPHIFLLPFYRSGRDSERQDERNFFGAILIFRQTIWELLFDLLGFRQACFSGIIILATFFSKRWKHFLHYFHQKIKTPKKLSFFFFKVLQTVFSTVIFKNFCLKI